MLKKNNLHLNYFSHSKRKYPSNYKHHSPIKYYYNKPGA